MSWKEHHSRSENFASQAELLLRSGDKAKAEELYILAAEEELKALEMLDKSKKRTLGITAVSAASLSFKAQEYRQVEKVVCQPGCFRAESRSLRWPPRENLAAPPPPARSTNATD